MSRGLLLHVDLDALRANYLTVRQCLPDPCAMSAVVKADTYGLGVKKIVPLFYKEGCRRFFVSRMGEAVTVKDTLPAPADIYILDGLQSEKDAALCKDEGFIPVLHTPEQFHFANGLPVALQFETGMNRVGLRAEDIADIPNNVDIRLVMTHPASADIPQSDQTVKQFARFEGIRRHFPDIPASFANSAAIFAFPQTILDVVRPGIALYGGESLPHSQTAIRDVVSLSAPVLQVRHINAGETVGYAASYIAPQGMTVATISIGYADGFFRCLGNGQGAVHINGVTCPVIGRVSMDLITVDVSACSHPLQTGTPAEIIGTHIPLARFAQNAGTIGYEVLTRLGNSIEKCYSC